MIRWVEIAARSSRERYTLLQDFMTVTGVTNEVSFIETDFDGFQNELIQAKKTFDQILIGPPFTEMAFDPTADMPAPLLSIKAADCVIKNKDQRWWPHSLLQEGFVHALAHHLKALDLNASALVVGAGGAARAVLSGLVRLGYNKFNITDRFEERGRVVIEDLRRSYFGVRFEFVPQVALTALPGMHSILVNATPLTAENELLRELQFLNFIKEHAAVVDLELIPPKTPLLTEAEQIGAKVINGVEIASYVDILWAQKIAGVSLGVTEYEKELFQRMSKIEVEPGIFD
jgi:shikimate dehydrogenase